ncbi:MAG: cytochrome c3 family protein [Sedimentisphaerales bacterium]
MSVQEFSSKRTQWLVITFLVVGISTLITWGGVQIFAEIPFEAEWASSGHADATAEAFTHWDGDVPPEIPTRCAKCHSTPGYLDYLGVDGTEAGRVDNPSPTGTTITCIACHNDATIFMDSVVFPSGIEVTGLGDEARCMQCHQGRESSVSVDAKIADANVPDDDTVSSKLSFRNIHYYAAAATQFGGMTMGGYQYAGKSYDVRFAHVEGIDTCISCHDQHSLELRVSVCSTCHAGVAGSEDIKHVRMAGSTSDYDGDGDVAEGIYYEVAGLQEILYVAIQAYAAAAGTPIVYDPHSYPYFFIDTNGNGQVDEGEASYGNRYNAWTPRLLRAAYNYQVSLKDPGGFAHGGKYIIQLLYDSIEDLDAALVAGLHRNDAGHFAGSKEAFRHWDDDGEVSGRCSKCHSATGLPFFLKEGVTVSQPVANGLQCSTCHDAIPEFTRYTVNKVEFPSGAVLDMADPNSNLCISCHQGRESTVSVDAAIAGLDPDAVSPSLRFKNVHYYAAGATLFGTEAKGAYEYTGKTYNGRLQHVRSFDTCIECHDTHTGEVKVQACRICHAGINEPEDIRVDRTDFDGDGNTQEGLAGEIETLREVLYAVIQDYAVNVSGTPILYANRYPYFFVDTNGNGQADEGEISYGNKYNAWTPRLLKAAYNYQYATKDPGGFAHNGKYVIQVLQDSIEDISAPR